MTVRQCERSQKETRESREGSRALATGTDVPDGLAAMLVVVNPRAMHHVVTHRVMHRVVMHVGERRSARAAQNGDGKAYGNKELRH